ncbi:FecR family protein [Desertivirga brevis]|uniref:FecR family protein n=1 Tax=Desertivirga brevis TaxID=2810310 RepID=UPI001A95A53B|nr:FecR family protein [Pedobacter sp. SYSU D00873]
MSEKRKNYLGDLSAKLGREDLSEDEKAVLNAFMEKKYQESVWDDNEMGNKEAVRASILAKIRKKKGARSLYPYAIAASAALVICLSILLIRVQGLTMQRFVTKSSADSVVLQDGSVIFLAANSEFEYPEKFAGNNREVRLLKGDAFFKVARNPERPFIIQSGPLQTKVLGTSFHIALSQNSCAVTVATGKVNVSVGEINVNLLPNQEAYYTNNKLIKQRGSKELLANWFRRELYLDQASLSEVFTVLKLRYGVTFQTDNAQLLNTKVSLYIEAAQSLQSILNQINYVTALKFKAYVKIVKVSQ